MKQTQDEVIKAGMRELALRRWKNTTKTKKRAHIKKMNAARLAKMRIK